MNGDIAGKWALLVNIVAFYSLKCYEGHQLKVINVSVDTILENVRDSMPYGKISRKQLVSHQDVVNIKMQLNINSNINTAELKRREPVYCKTSTIHVILT